MWMCGCVHLCVSLFVPATTTPTPIATTTATTTTRIVLQLRKRKKQMHWSKWSTFGHTHLLPGQFTASLSRVACSDCSYYFKQWQAQVTIHIHTTCTRTTFFLNHNQTLQMTASHLHASNDSRHRGTGEKRERERKKNERRQNNLLNHCSTPNYTTCMVQRSRAHQRHGEWTHIDILIHSFN